MRLLSKHLPHTRGDGETRYTPLHDIESRNATAAIRLPTNVADRPRLTPRGEVARVRAPLLPIP